MRDLTDIKDLFVYDGLENDYRFERRVFDTEFKTFNKQGHDEHLIWGDLV